MKHLFRTALSLIALTLVVSACNVQSPRRYSPVDDPGTASIDGGQIRVNASTKIDMVFVLDNSASMQNHIDNLSKNIDQFVDVFGRNGLIDFHIGILMIHDRVKYGVKIKDFPAWGQLISLKDKSGKILDGPRYVSRETPNYKEVLRSTLHVKVFKIGEEGPAYEELISPVVQSIISEDPAVVSANAGFRRKDAYFLPIFLSDADDLSEITKEEAGRVILSTVTSEDKFVPVGVLSRIGDRKCPHDDTTGGDPWKMQSFIRDYQGEAFNLCKETFGSDLAHFADVLIQRVARKVLKLPWAIDFEPCYEGLRRAKQTGTSEEDVMHQCVPVTCGDQRIPYNREKGWAYDRAHVSVILSGKLELKSNCEVIIDHKRLQQIGVRNGQVKVLSPAEALKDDAQEAQQGGIPEMKKSVEKPAPAPKTKAELKQDNTSARG